MTQVWSERVEPAGVVGLHDCAYSAALMLLVHGGKTSFPLGIYSPEERNRLETFDNRPNNTGALPADIKLAVQRAYGITLPELPTSQLQAKLSVVGPALSVSGSYSRFPLGHWLRRWQPNFTGGHQVCVIPRGDGTVLWLDPLAPNRYGGDIRPVADVMQFAWINWTFFTINGGSLASMPDASVASPKEADMDYSGSEVAFDSGFPTFTLTQGSNFRKTPQVGDNVWAEFPSGTPVVGFPYTVDGDVLSGAPQDGNQWRPALMYVADRYRVGYFHTRVLQAKPQPVTGFTQAELDAAVAQATSVATVSGRVAGARAVLEAAKAEAAKLGA